MGESKTYDIAFEHYRGQRRYIVTHPEYSGALVVAAPDEVSAIVAAAEKWQTRWQNFEFYAFCEVKLGIYNRRKAYKDRNEGEHDKSTSCQGQKSKY